jgi:hypothetical protein
MMEIFSQNAAPGERRIPAGPPPSLSPKEGATGNLMTGEAKTVHRKHQPPRGLGFNSSGPRIDYSKKDC